MSGEIFTLKQEIENFNKRWNIKEDYDYKAEFQKFKQRVLTIFNNIDLLIGASSVREFCLFFGINPEFYDSTGDGLFRSDDITYYLESENNEVAYYKALQILLKFFSAIDGGDGMLDEFERVLSYSNINLACNRKDNEIILYPKGEDLLDEKLVNEALSFLSGKPNNHFVEALSFYEQCKSVKSVECLRRCLEEFLKEFLGNKKGLNSNIPELHNHLKDNNLKNIINNLLRNLDIYFNEQSKHDDGDISEEENEYLIYQVALLMRYLSKIKPDQKADN